MDQIIETHNEYIIIDRKVLDELIERAVELDKDSKGVYSQGIAKGIHEAVKLIKEKNVIGKPIEVKA